MQKPIVIFVGNLIKRKNVNVLLEAKKLSNVDYELVVVGGGPLFKELNKMVKNDNIEGVTFTGPRNDVENLIPSADLLVLPSFSESFGLVLIEALACEVPVIGSNVGGIKEIITENVGLLINPNDAKSVSTAIDKLLTDKQLYNTFKSNARSRAMDFSEVKIPYDEMKKWKKQ